MSDRFQNLINSEKPVLVDFYADWCVPCRLMTPVLKTVKEDLRDQVWIVKVNVDRNPVLASRYNIRSIPTLMLFRRGHPHWTRQGVPSSAEIHENLSAHL